MQEIHSSNPSVVTEICDPNNSRAQQHYKMMMYLLIDTMDFKGTIKLKKIHVKMKDLFHTLLKMIVTLCKIVYQIYLS